MSTFLAIAILSYTGVRYRRALSSKKIIFYTLGNFLRRHPSLDTWVAGSLIIRGVVYEISWYYGRSDCELGKWSKLQQKKIFFVNIWD